MQLFDEFEEFATPESKFAHAMDNLQPLLLNNSNGGGDWKEHDVSAEQVYGRQRKTRLGSERLYEKPSHSSGKYPEGAEKVKNEE